MQRTDQQYVYSHGPNGSASGFRLHRRYPCEQTEALAGIETSPKEFDYAISENTQLGASFKAFFANLCEFLPPIFCAIRPKA